MEDTMNNINGNTPCFSVIIPHYNSVGLLQNLISTIPLEKKDLEIIIVDDRSDQNLEDLRCLRRKYEGRIKFYRNNNGKKSAGTARNIGLRHARGKWIIFADADDYFSKQFYDLIDEHRESDSDIIYFSADSIELNTGVQADRHEKIKRLVSNYCEIHSKQNENKLRFGFIEPVSKMIKRELVINNSIRFSEVIAANDKWFSTLTGYYANKIDACDKVLYIITKSSGSLTQKVDEKAYSDRMGEALKQLCFLKKHLTKNEFNDLDMDVGWLFTSAVYKGYSIKFIIYWILVFLRKRVVPINREKLGTMVKVLVSRNTNLEKTHLRQTESKNNPKTQSVLK